MSLTLAVLALPLGFGLGRAYFALLARAVSARLGNQPFRNVLALDLLRLGLAGAGFGIAVQGGAWPLLAAFVGFLAGRQLSIRRAGVAP